MKHYVFGSEDSRDYDILYLIPKDITREDCKPYFQIDASKKLCAEVALDLITKGYYVDKPLNVNLAVLEDGVLTYVFKGPVCEVNNSVLATYQLHKQMFPLEITRSLPRNIGLKNLRAMRTMLSFISRTQYRSMVKEALNGSAVTKAEMLAIINFGYITKLGHKNTTLVDLYKTNAFQMGQCMALNEGVELYTKSAIADRYPQLRDALNRKSAHDPQILEEFKHQWLKSFDPTTIPQYE